MKIAREPCPLCGNECWVDQEDDYGGDYNCSKCETIFGTELNMFYDRPAIREKQLRMVGIDGIREPCPFCNSRDIDGTQNIFSTILCRGCDSSFVCVRPSIYNRRPYIRSLIDTWEMETIEATEKKAAKEQQPQDKELPF